MRKSGNKDGGVLSYLESTGVLNKTEEDISNARKEYWKKYKALWRKKKRNSEKEFTISFNSEEVNMLTHAAKLHHTSRTHFIKQAIFAYLNKSFIVPDQLQVRQIRQLLSMHYNLFSDQVEQEKISIETGRQFLQTIEQLEREVLIALHHPKTLEDWISETVKKNSENKISLQQLLNSL